MTATNAIIETLRFYVNLTEKDRSQYRPVTMRHLVTLLEASMSKPDDYNPLKEWASNNFEGKDLEYIESLIPRKVKNVKKSETLADNEPGV